MARYSVNNYTVETLLSNIKSGSIAIPEMQRPFVWDSSKVRDLVDSLYKGFPVGYIIVWQNPDVKLKDGTKSSGKKVLIDGQQRITAMAAAIVGQEVLDDHYKWKRISIAFNPVEEKFEVANNAILKSSKWIPDIAPVLEPAFDTFSFVMEYCQKNEITDQMSQVNNIVNRLRGIQNNSLGGITLAEDLDIDSVTEIFIRINSKGVVLSQADFAMSKISSNETYGGNITRKTIDYTAQHAESRVNLNDAFGIPFQAIEEPMPNVKLAGGFDVTLRTMFKKQRCQTRYGKIENASYPISPQMRMGLQAALEWAGSSEQKDTTWINTDKNEVLFAYPSSLPKQPVSFTAIFKQNCDKSIAFSSQAKQFIQELKQTKEIGTDSNAKRITIFVLRKIDKARTKVVYTRQTDPYELEKCSEEWTLGCANLPPFSFGTPKTLYPLDIADVLNRFWKQSGEVATDKFKPVPQYHGIEILMDSKLSVSADLHRLSESAMSIGSFFGNLSAKNAWSQPMQKKAKDMLALKGLIFYRERIGKEKYMESLPYLYGQLLKAADELHALYCKVVRNGEVPSQFVGGTLFQSAAEAPIRTLNILSQRIMPYYSWGKKLSSERNYGSRQRKLACRVAVSDLRANRG